MVKPSYLIRGLRFLKDVLCAGEEGKMTVVPHVSILMWSNITKQGARQTHMWHFFVLKLSGILVNILLQFFTVILNQSIVTSDCDAV